MTTKRILSMVLVLVLALSLLAGCGPKDDKIKVAYVTMDITSPYFVKLIEGMEKKAEELGYELTVSDGKYKAQPQIDAMETYIGQGVDVIVLSANDVEALQPQIDAAKKAGIKVVGANVAMKNLDAFVSLDEYAYGYEGGKIAGAYIKDKMDGKAKVGILTFTQIPAVIERGRGLKEGIQSLAPDAEFVFENDASNRQEGLEAGENMLQSNPDVNCVVGISDDAVLGAYEAFVAAGKEGDQVVMVGLDAVDEAIAKIKEGGIYRGTVDIKPYESGILIMEAVQDVLEDGPVKDMVKFPMVPVTADNLGDHE